MDTISAVSTVAVALFPVSAVGRIEQHGTFLLQGTTLAMSVEIRLLLFHFVEAAVGALVGHDHCGSGKLTTFAHLNIGLVEEVARRPSRSTGRRNCTVCPPRPRQISLLASAQRGGIDRRRRLHTFGLVGRFQRGDGMGKLLLSSKHDIAEILIMIVGIPLPFIIHREILGGWTIACSLFAVVGHRSVDEMGDA